MPRRTKDSVNNINCPHLSTVATGVESTLVMLYSAQTVQYGTLAVTVSCMQAASDPQLYWQLLELALGLSIFRYSPARSSCGYFQI